jgi:hypothetical protein
LASDWREAGGMSVTAGSDLPLDELLARQRALVEELRDVDHWHRLAAARLDLAVAAVTDIDELAQRPVPCTRLAPHDLHTLVGIPDTDEALPETAVLLRLRSVLEELETYAAALRASCHEVAREVIDRLDAEGYLQGSCRPLADPRTEPRLIRRAVTRRPRPGHLTGRTTTRRSPSVIIPMSNPGGGDDW